MLAPLNFYLILSASKYCSVSFIFPETITAKEDIPDNEQSEQLIQTTESSSFEYVETKNSFTTWPTIEEFTIELGANKIDEYLASFETEEDWLYVIYYHGTKDLICSDIHKYQVVYFDLILLRQ